MTDRPNNPSAFPVSFDVPLASGGKYRETSGGMDLRDWFAGQALAGLCAYSGTYGFQDGPDSAAERAYECADAMLAARTRTED